MVSGLGLRSQPNLDTYSLTAIWKILSELSQTFIPTSWGRGAKPLFGTDFELWPKISLQRNTRSTIEKTCQSTGTPLHTPKVDELWSTNGWERLASFCPPLTFSHSENKMPGGLTLGLASLSTCHCCAMFCGVSDRPFVTVLSYYWTMHMTQLLSQ